MKNKMSRHYIPGAQYIDEMQISLLLTSIENNRSFLEGAIYEALSTRAGAEIDISQL